MRFANLTFAALPYVGLALLSSTAPAAHAQVLVTSRPALGATDSIDWSQLGPSFTTVPSPFTVTSMGGMSVTGTLAVGNFLRYDQSNGWDGNFSPGEALLFTNDPLGAGPITFTFATPISAGGANIQEDIIGPFTATLTALDSMGNVVGTFTEAGNSTANADGSAIFIGIRNPTANITQLVFNTDNTNFAINTLGFTPNPVPEPGSIALLTTSALTGAGFLALRRKQAHQAA